MFIQANPSFGKIPTAYASYGREPFMARPLRLAFKNAVYHITARGNKKDKIFVSAYDKSVFIEKMNEAFNKYSFVCYAFCLMNNHYHLFLKTPLPNISSGMHYLNGSYTNWLKTKYKIAGVIFQGRYKSILVDEDNYALSLSAYIHLNPLRAGIVRTLENYPWSSYPEYMGIKKPRLERLDTSFVLNRFGNHLESARKTYQEFLYESLGMKNPLKQTYKGFVLGSPAYIVDIKRKILGLGKNREITETHIIPNETLTLEEIIQEFSETLQVSKSQFTKKGKNNIYRSMILYVLKKNSHFSLKEIGNFFNMDYVAVAKAAKRYEEKILANEYLLEIAQKGEEAFNRLQRKVKC